MKKNVKGKPNQVKAKTKLSQQKVNAKKAALTKVKAVNKKVSVVSKKAVKAVVKKAANQVKSKGVKLSKQSKKVVVKSKTKSKISVKAVKKAVLVKKAVKKQPVKKAVVAKQSKPVIKKAAQKVIVKKAVKKISNKVVAVKKAPVKKVLVKKVLVKKASAVEVKNVVVKDKAIKPQLAPVVLAPVPVSSIPTKKVRASKKNAVDPDAFVPFPYPARRSSIQYKANARGAILFDSHMHTSLCKHASGEPEEYVQRAYDSGFKGVIFTCHSPMPEGFWPSVRMAESEFSTYVEIVQRAKEKFKGKMEVCLGLESEFFPGYEKWVQQMHTRAEFDYVLGGLHWQGKEYLQKYETSTIEAFRRTYFNHLAQAAETGLYDCLAHPDLVKNYQPDCYCFSVIKSTVALALDRIVKTGVAMELNTSGMHKSYREMNPGDEILQMMAERNIPIVLGSDAHQPKRVGENYLLALKNLKDAGYKTINYFQKRERIEVPIDVAVKSLEKAAKEKAHLYVEEFHRV
jgi:histidinol-phosphatase (PHP family)